MSWIQGPWVDLGFFSFGWLPVLFIFWIFDRHAVRTPDYSLILVLVLGFSFLHRHITFPLVYADPEQFQQRKKTFVVLPIFFLAITLLGLFWVYSPSFKTPTIPEPVHVVAGDLQTFRIYGEKSQKTLNVVFTGQESDLNQVASRLNQGLLGLIQVEAAGDRLTYSIPKGSWAKGWTLGAAHGAGEFQKTLGLAELKGKIFRESRPLLLLLLIATTLWNFYHTIMQKVGLLRIYSRRGGGGEAWLDKSMVWAYFAVLFFGLAILPKMRQQVAGLNFVGNLLSASVTPLQHVLPWVLALSLGLALFLSGLYLKKELANPKGFQWPKNLFFLSILLLYAIFFYDFLVGFAVMGFSHALEYLAFVYIFTRRKYLARPEGSSLLARWARRQAMVFSVYIVLMVLLFSGWHWYSQATLEIYIVGSSFLHFLYDGWIWKVRNPKVGSALGIQYPSPAAQAAQSTT